jgi:hypothetical protein
MGFVKWLVDLNCIYGALVRSIERQMMYRVKRENYIASSCVNCTIYLLSSPSLCLDQF